MVSRREKINGEVSGEFNDAVTGEVKEKTENLINSA
jgi:hypothetical protein